MAGGLVTAMSYRCIDGDRNGLGNILVGTKPELTVSVALLYRAQGAQKGAQTEEPRFLSPPIGRLTLPQSAGQAFFFFGLLSPLRLDAIRRGLVIGRLAALAARCVLGADARKCVRRKIKARGSAREALAVASATQRTNSAS